MAPVLKSSDDFCEPQKNIQFERYRFYARAQEAGESFDKFVTELRQLSSTCDFENISIQTIVADLLSSLNKPMIFVPLHEIVNNVDL